MPWHLVFLNTLSFFSIVVVYMALLDIAHTVPAFPGMFGLTGMNIWYMAATAAGILCFGYAWRQLSQQAQRKSLGAALGGNGLGLAALGAGSASAAGNVAFLYAGALLFPLTAGYIAGYLYYLISRRIPAARQGTCIGLFLALTNLLLYVLDALTKVTGAPLFLPWSFLLPVLAAMAWLLLRYDFGPATENAEVKIAEPHPFVARHLSLLLALAVLLSLLVGFSDTLNFLRHEEYYTNWHALSRLFIVAGSLLAGWLADFHPAYLPLAALLSKAAVMGFYAFALEGAPFAFMVCADVFFTSFTIVFLTWLFLHVAIRSHRPEFWAGMGRAIEMPVSAIGTLLGVSLLNSFSSITVTLLVYTALLVLTGALFYYGLLQYNRSMQTAVAGMPFAEPDVFFPQTFPKAPEKEEHAAVAPDASLLPKSEMAAADYTEEETPVQPEIKTEAAPALLSEEKLPPVKKAETAAPETAQPQNIMMKPEREQLQERFGLTRRETEVLLALLNNETITEISERFFITPRTTKFHISNILKKTGAKNARELPYIVQK